MCLLAKICMYNFKHKIDYEVKLQRNKAGSIIIVDYNLCLCSTTQAKVEQNICNLKFISILHAYSICYVIEK